MSDETISREELYNRIWTTPFVRLAQSLGYSYLELVRVCADLNIPRPNGGYWYRLAHGAAPEQVPLPPAALGTPKEIKVRLKTSDPQPVPAEDSVGRPETDQIAESGQAAAGKSQVAAAAEVPPASPVADVVIPASFEYTRAQLHKAIWSEPCLKLAAKLGISDVALAKTCRRMGVPRPPRGYWARVEAGEKLRREPLPTAKPGQSLVVEFRVAENAARRKDWAAHNLATPMRKSKGGVVELPAEGTELHPIAEKHRLALGRAKAGELGFVRVRAKDLFACELSAAMVPRVVGALHAMLCELEDRDFGFKPGSSEFQGLQITRDNDQVTLLWTEARLEMEREPTPEDKRRPSWTWKLKEIKPSGGLSIEISAVGLRGKRKWTEGDGRSLEQLLHFIVEKVEAVFRGFGEHRKREEEWEKQREEQDRRDRERRALEAEMEAKQELAREERERILQHTAKLDEIAAGRCDKLCDAARQWTTCRELIIFIETCEQRWRQGGELSEAQTHWLNWARTTALNLEPFENGYPDPVADGPLDYVSIPVGGPYPASDDLEEEELEEDEPEVRHEAATMTPPQQFPYWLMHRRR